MTKCDHHTKVIEWNYELKDGQMDEYPSLYGCTKCEATSPKPFPSWESLNESHDNCDEEPCFGCKARTLELSTGEANSRVIQSTKAHDKELGSYFDATAQGIEPISTKKKDIDAAVAISNETGKAFDGGNPASSLYN